jgi:hypothetical protein
MITPIGEHFYAFRLGDLANPRWLGRHGVKLPHGMKRTASGRYIVYGSMDNPADPSVVQVLVGQRQNIDQCVEADDVSEVLIGTAFAEYDADICVQLVPNPAISGLIMMRMPAGCRRASE